MDTYVVIYNPQSEKGKGLENAERIERLYPGAEFSYQNLMEEGFSYADFLRHVPEETKVVITGGDGTLNNFLNALDTETAGREFYFFPAGTGNDFVNDLGLSKDCDPILLNSYLKYLPTLTIEGKDFSARFINGVGGGLDGYCCAEYARLKKQGKKKAYVSIAADGVLGAYAPGPASITVDGVKEDFPKVWMVSVMFGRFYGGGVKIAPFQDRNNPDHEISCVTVNSPNRLWTILLYLAATKGKGFKFPKNIETRTGHTVRVEFADPVDLQIDGETVEGVTAYTVKTVNA